MPPAWLVEIEAPELIVILPPDKIDAESVNVVDPTRTTLPAVVLPRIIFEKPSANLRETPLNNVLAKLSVLPVEPKLILPPLVSGSRIIVPAPE